METARKSVSDMANWKIRGNKAIVARTRIPGSNQGMARKDSFIGMELGGSEIETAVFPLSLVNILRSHPFSGSQIRPRNPSAAARESGAVIIRMYCGHFVGQTNKKTFQPPTRIHRPGVFAIND